MRKSLANLYVLVVLALCGYLAATTLYSPPIEPTFSRSVQSAYWYLDHGKYNAARNAMRKARSLRANHPDITILESLVRLSKSFEYELVKARAQSLLMYDRHKSSILIVLGRNEYRQKNYAAAERYYLDAISINQNDAAAWHWLAKSTDKARGPENAIVQYEKAYELEKDAESIAEDYAMALMKVGRPQDAAEIYKSLVEMEEHNIEYVLQWATALIQAGSTDSSQAVVERLWTGMSDPLLRQKKVNKKEWSIFYKGETIALKNYSEKEKFVCTLPGAGNHEICLKSV